MVYQAGRIKRRRRTKAQVEQLDSQILAVLAEDHPQSVRHVYYRMTDPRPGGCEDGRSERATTPETLGAHHVGARLGRRRGDSVAVLSPQNFQQEISRAPVLFEKATIYATVFEEWGSPFMQRFLRHLWYNSYHSFWEILSNHGGFSAFTLCIYATLPMVRIAPLPMVQTSI